MRHFRVSIGHLMAIVAVVTIGFIPLNNPSRAWLGILMYLRFTILLTAIFLARYGRNRDWWFGFAAFGWASILFSVPGLWNAVSYERDQFDWFNLTNSLGELLQTWRGERPDQPIDYYFTATKFAAVLQFWATMTLSFIGGYLALFIKSRSNDTHGKGNA